MAQGILVPNIMSRSGLVPNGDAFVVFRFPIANCSDIHVDYPWIS